MLFPTHGYRLSIRRNRWVCRCVADDPDPAVTITDSAGCPNAFSTGGKTRNAVQPGNNLNLELKSIKPRHADPGQRKGKALLLNILAGYSSGVEI